MRTHACRTPWDFTLREPSCNKVGTGSSFLAVGFDESTGPEFLPVVGGASGETPSLRFFSAILLGARQLFFPASSDNSLCGSLCKSFSQWISGCSDRR